MKRALAGADLRPDTLGVSADGEPGLAGTVKRLLASGDTAAARRHFAMVVARYQRRATRIALSYLRDPAEADEAVQDAFVKAFQHLPFCREEARFELWLSRIVVNGCLDRLRTKKRRDRWLQSAGDHLRALSEGRATPEPTPEQRLLAQERRTQLLEAVNRLPSRQRSVVMLSQFAGYSLSEVASILRINEVTARVHLFRAIRSLRRTLARDQSFLVAGLEREAV